MPSYSITIPYGVNSGGSMSSSNLAFDAQHSSGAYGAGGTARVRPRAFGTLACVYLGS